MNVWEKALIAIGLIFIVLEVSFLRDFTWL